MKKLLTLYLLTVIFNYSYGQTTIYSQNFNSGSAPEWSLNTGTLGGDSAALDNQWIINNVYNGGGVVNNTPDEPAGILGYPESNYMHIYSYLGYLLGYPKNDNFDAGGTGSTYFAQLNTPLNTTTYTNVYFSFWWICSGDALSAGKVYYRTSSTGTWTQITTPLATFYGATGWSVDSLHLAAFDDRAYLQFGFQFTDGDASGTDPAFGIDDISVTGVSSITAPVAGYSASSPATCQDSCITVTSTTTGTVDSLRWTTTAPGATISAPTYSLTSICFPMPGSYSVTLTAYNGAGSNAYSNVVAVSPTPYPAITKTGHVLSVPNVYTSYQWYSNTTAITGATTYTYTYTTEGPTYSVVVDSAGCQGTSTLISTVEVANVSNSGQLYWVSNSGTNSMLTASSNLDDNIIVQIFDATGRRISEQTWEIGSSNLAINTTNLPGGLYIIKLTGINTDQVLKWMKF